MSTTLLHLVFNPTDMHDASVIVLRLPRCCKHLLTTMSTFQFRYNDNIAMWTSNATTLRWSAVWYMLRLQFAKPLRSARMMDERGIGAIELVNQQQLSLCDVPWLKHHTSLDQNKACSTTIWAVAFESMSSRSDGVSIHQMPKNSQLMIFVMCPFIKHHCKWIR